MVIGLKRCCLKAKQCRSCSNCSIDLGLYCLPKHACPKLRINRIYAYCEMRLHSSLWICQFNWCFHCPVPQPPPPPTHPPTWAVVPNSEGLNQIKGKLKGYNSEIKISTSFCTRASSKGKHLEQILSFKSKPHYLKKKKKKYIYIYFKH